MSYTIFLDSRISRDLQKAIDFYKLISVTLSRKFYRDFKSRLNAIKRTPYFQIKYDKVRCLPLKKFPYMIHFSIEESEKVIRIHAVTCDYSNPDDNYPYTK